MKTVKDFIFVGAAAIIFIIIGIALLSAVIYYTTGNENYVKTSATVTHTEIWRNENGYVAQITYEYYVNGERYVKQSPHIRDASSSKFEGDTLFVYYNPDNPEEVTEGNNMNFSVLFFGIAFLVIGGGLFAFTLKGIKKKNEISINNKLTD